MLHLQNLWLCYRLEIGQNYLASSWSGQQALDYHWLDEFSNSTQYLTNPTLLKIKAPAASHLIFYHWVIILHMWLVTEWLQKKAASISYRRTYLFFYNIKLEEPLKICLNCRVPSFSGIGLFFSVEFFKIYLVTSSLYSNISLPTLLCEQLCWQLSKDHRIDVFS